ncbi:hypothetical protein JL721_11465 [Aureococcus anophagefferens]|nr:hypothetical protein JL721_11465 [Aureococcus anophagefferens]KAH8069609.1 hypothetical protein JL720_11907 [Aureococcus anophagefferens]
MFIRATVASALLAFADAQGMGDGLAKSTYASSDPLPGLEFMLKYLPVTVAIDSCPSNVCKEGARSPDGAKTQGSKRGRNSQLQRLLSRPISARFG